MVEKVGIKNMEQEFTLNICLECKKRQPNCCRLGIQLTVEDIENIRSLGFDLKEFLELKDYSTIDIADYDDWWKKGLVKVEDKIYKIVVKKDTRGECAFLKDEKGCVLGDKRPSVCKIFPFWFKEETGKVVYEEGEPYCLLEKEAVGVSDALKAIQETPESVEGYYSAMKEDCLSNQVAYRKIVEELLSAKE